MTDSAIEVTGLSKSYGDESVLDGLDITVKDGDIYGLLGPNGTGKTTTIDILTGTLHPDEGKVDIDGTDPTEDPISTRQKIGFLPEKESPPSFLTPQEYFEFVGKTREIDTEELNTRVEEWVEELSLDGKLDILCKDLSRGQQQKVMLVQAFVHEPDIVFIDEPLANLDPLMQERVKKTIQKLNDDGTTIVLSTHHVEVAEDLCSTVGILDGGDLVTTIEPASTEDPLLEVFIDHVESDDGD